MTESKLVTVSWCEDVPATLGQAIAFFHNVAKRIPEEYRSGAYLEFPDHTPGSVTLSYVRPVTAQEIEEAKAESLSKDRATGAQAEQALRAAEAALAKARKAR